MSGPKNGPVMRILDAQDKELMAVRKFAREGNDLVIRGKIFGAMPMVAKVIKGAEGGLQLHQAFAKGDKGWVAVSGAV